MPEKKRVGDLEIGQDLAFQEKEWQAERIGWVVMAIVVLAALAGLFGSGPLSSAEQRSERLQVQHHRVLRYHAPTEMNVEFTPAQLQDGKASFWIDREYMDRFKIERISPEPDSTRLLPDRIIYEFQADEANQPLRVKFQLQPEMPGMPRARFGEDSGGSTLEFGQVVLP